MFIIQYKIDLRDWYENDSAMIQACFMLKMSQ